MKPTDPPSPKASAGQGPVIVHHHTPEELHNDDVAHEDSDVSIQGLVMSAVAIAAVMVVTAVLMYALFWWVLEPQAEASAPKLSPLAPPATAMPKTTNESPYFGGAPQPQLLTNEPSLLRQVRERDSQQLHEYGWVDEKTGVARIPIDDAKKLLLERGVPSRADAPTDPRLGTHAAAFGEATSGRSITAPSNGGGDAQPKPAEPPPAAKPAEPKSPH
jgi:hypothetical protein